MSVFPLPIFPEASLASSVVTTVWIGVLIFGFFHLRLGWVFSGLVVPGYLVPIIILRPLSALTILVEAILAYGVVSFGRQVMLRTKVSCELFGRDRFFALLIVSVMIRILADSTLWPLIGDTLFQRFGFDLDYQHQLSSFGLIVICLIANQFWKTGLIRGLPPFLTVLGVTFIAIRYGLMELTNFSMSNLGYMYEDVATSLEASPKAYIVLITTAFLASRMNVLYGWDFSGILIPALIALQWFEPLKVLTSMGEALVILWLGILSMKLPIFRSLTIEGARKLMLFFTISYLYKIGLSYLLMGIAPDFKVSDAYGFGYLLPTLMATKMHQTGQVIRQIRMTLQLSLFSTAAASLLGLSLTLLPDGGAASPAPISKHSQRKLEEGTSFLQALRSEEIRSMQMHLRNSRLLPSVQEREGFRQGILAAMRYAETSAKVDLESAQTFLRRAGYRVEELKNRYLLIAEGPRYRGWGVYFIDRDTSNGLCIESPQTLDEIGTFEASSALFQRTEARALALGTLPSRGAVDKKSPLNSRLTLFHIFHRLVGNDGVVQVRGYRERDQSEMVKAWPSIRDSKTKLQSSCWIKDRPPSGFQFEALGTIAQSLVYPRVVSPMPNAQRDAHRSRFLEVYLTDADITALTRTQDHDEKGEMVNRRTQSYLLDKLIQEPPLVALKGTDVYRAPRKVDLYYMDERILTPLVRLARAWPTIEATWRDQLDILNQRASWFHYSIRLLGSESEPRHLILMPDEGAFDSRARHWGIIALRIGTANEVVLEVPRPGTGMRVVNFALTWFEPMEARALILAGAHPDTNKDKSSDILLFQNRGSLFTLMHEVLLRESGNAPMLALQCRALARVEPHIGKADTPNIAFLATHGADAASSLVDMVETQLKAASLNLRRVQGEVATAGYDVGSHIHTRYLAAAANKGFGILWLSPELRSRYAPHRVEELATDAFASFGMPTEQVSLTRWLSSRPSSPTKHAESLTKAMVESIDRFLESGDVNAIQSLVNDYPTYRFRRLLDYESGQTFLVSGEGEGWSVIMSIHSSGNEQTLRSWVADGAHENLVDQLVTQQRRLIVHSTEEEGGL